jgi:hypothetical protein
MKELIMNTAKTGTPLAPLHASFEFTARLFTIRRLLVMNSPLLVAVSTTLIFASVTFGDAPKELPKTQTIPLDKIWGYNMPGTARAEDLDPSGKLFMQIRRSLWSLPSEQEEAAPSFAVSGTKSEAIREVHAVLVDGKKPRKSFPPSSQIYATFFSYQNRPYVHLQKVERKGNVININWSFVPHETEETTEHFALIPLGQLPNGKYRVDIKRSPMPQKYIDLGFRPMSDAAARRIVCRSFSFTVLKKDGSHGPVKN